MNGRLDDYFQILNSLETWNLLCAQIGYLSSLDDSPPERNEIKLLWSSLITSTVQNFIQNKIWTNSTKNTKKRTQLRVESAWLIKSCFLPLLLHKHYSCFFSLSGIRQPHINVFVDDVFRPTEGLQSRVPPLGLSTRRAPRLRCDEWDFGQEK